MVSQRRVQTQSTEEPHSSAGRLMRQLLEQAAAADASGEEVRIRYAAHWRHLSARRSGSRRLAALIVEH